MDSTTEHLWKIYDNISELIRFSDTKAVAILATVGVVAGLYFSNVSTMQSILSTKQYALFPLAVSIVLLLLSGFYCTKCLFPRVKSEKCCDIVFFADIAKKHSDPVDYEKAVKSACLNCDTIDTQLSHQIWQISKIAQYKYAAVKQSVPYFVASMGATIFLIIVLLA